MVPILTVDEAARETIDLEAPLIIRGACDRARIKWTNARLIEFMGDRRCVVSLDSRPRLGPNRKESLLSEFLEKQPLESPGGDPPTDGRDLEYLFHAEVDTARASELLGDLDLPSEILQLGTARLYQLYVGPAWSGTLPHCHERAINALARGRKRWAIYVGRDKRETEALRKESYEAYGSGSQAAPWFSAECEKLKSRGIRFWDFIQEPGDVVYIPTFYLHAVMNLEPVVGFSAELHDPDAVRKNEERRRARADKILSAQCMTGPYMEAGARRLLPYMEKHGLGKNVLELGPSRHPLVTPETCEGRIVYVEISDQCLQFLRDKFGDSVTIVKFDLNRAWESGDNALGRELGESFDSLVMSQVVNYVDVRDLMQACAATTAPNATLFFNNVMNHGAAGLFHSGRPKDMEEFLEVASAAGFDPVEVVTEPAGVADAEKVRDLAVLRRRA
jgi:hypothetical protein